MRRALLFSALVLPLLASEPEPQPAAEKPPEAVALPEPVTREGSVEIDGRQVRYEVTTAKLQLKKDDGTPRASIFHISYLRQGGDGTAPRPVTFAFNGGPGSSSVWLHLGLLGPRRVDIPGDGTEAPKPPCRLVPNEFSLLDVTDLVFIDPVSTGYSRAEDRDKAGEFHGLEEDIASVGDFIRRWVTEHGRWASPKFLIGESYGGIRAAGVAQHLQSRYGMSLNGVVLLSSLLDFRTLVAGEDDHITYSVYLPAYAAVAAHHGKLAGDAGELVAQARELAFGDYAVALLKGNELGGEELDAMAGRLAALTGLPAELWRETRLRLEPSRFRAELLADEGLTLGRFDARVAWPTADAASPWPGYDPSYALAYGAYSTAMLSYLGGELGWKEEAPYEILTGKVQPWKWDRQNRYVNLRSELEEALRENPHLRVLVQKAACDLATPPDGIDYSLRQMIDAAPSARERIVHADYEAGHMFYLNPPDLEKARVDLVEFIQQCL